MRRHRWTARQPVASKVEPRSTRSSRQNTSLYSAKLPMESKISAEVMGEGTKVAATNDESAKAAKEALHKKARERRLPYGWTLETDGVGDLYFQSTSGKAEFNLEADLKPVFAEPSKEQGGTEVAPWVRFVCIASSKESIYYQHSYTSETTYEIPALYYKQQKEKKHLPMPKFQIAVMKIQCAWRQKYARSRTNWIRATNHQRFAGSHAQYIKTFHPHYHQYYWYNPNKKVVTWSQPQPEDEYNFATAKSSLYPEWFRMWDPSHKQHYYYHTFEGNWQFTKPISYNAAMWAFGQRSGFPPILHSTLAIQTMYRARVTRTKIVKEREVREKMTADERMKYMEKRALDLAEKKRVMMARREAEKEANENAMMAHEESMQRVRGDTFWGVDIAAQAKQHRMDVERRQREKVAAEKKKKEQEKKEAAERRKRMKNSRRSAMKREIFEGDEMAKEEALQRNFEDTFWGVDKEERDRRLGVHQMTQEDEASRNREILDKLNAMHTKWGKELEQSKAQEKLSEASKQYERRAGYMDMFYDSVSSNEVIEYVWPGSRRAVLDSYDSFADVDNQSGKIAGFGMENVYSKQRLNAPASIYHDLNPLRSAPPRAARDFLVKEHSGDGFLLLPHLWECRKTEMQSGGVPPEMVQRMLDSRQTTASRSLLSPSRAEAKRLREMEMRLMDRRRPTEADERSEDRPSAHAQKYDEERDDSRSIASEDATRSQGSELGDDEPSGRSAIILDADVRGVLRRSKHRKIARKSARQRNKGGGSKRRKRQATKRSRRAKDGDRGSSKTEFVSDEAGSQGAASSERPPPPPPPPMEVVIDLSEEQKERLKVIFDLMDGDHSGMVDQHEMMVALRTNKRVIEFVTKSKLLAPLLLDAEFARTFMAMDPNSDGGVSFEEFVEFMQENSSEEAVIADMQALAEEKSQASLSKSTQEENTAEGYESKAVTVLGEMVSKDQVETSLKVNSGQEVTQTVLGQVSGGVSALLRRVFKMLDTNGTGTMGRREFLFALKGLPDLRDFVSKSPPLSKLVKHKKFLDSLQQLPDPMRQNDFVEMGSEIAIQIQELEAAQANTPDPLTADEVEKLRDIITVSFSGKKFVTKSKLTRLLLSTKVSGKLLTASHDALAPLLKPRTFKKTLAELDTDKDDSITIEEVVAFCTNFVGTVHL